MAIRGPQNGQRGLERGLYSSSLIKFFDSNIPSMRKVNGGEKRGGLLLVRIGEKENNDPK